MLKNENIAYTEDKTINGFGVSDFIDSSKENVRIKSLSKILVIGVGGCGGNIVDAMYSNQKNKEDVGFLLCNTDEDALRTKSVPMKTVLGPTVTKGKGAGGDPRVGEEAAHKSEDQIFAILDEFKPDMVFITAGMGGGTGTGAAPVIAEIAHMMNILTVGVFTMPFEHEGSRKRQCADIGLEKAIPFLDGRIIINNEELFHCGAITKAKAYSQANNVLIEAASGIADIILTQFRENIDFRDVDSCIRGQGLINIGTAYSEKRTPDTARLLIHNILNSPLIADKDIYGSKNVIFTVRHGYTDGILISEYQAILRAISEATGGSCETLKFADVYDNELGENNIKLTLIATGYTGKERVIEGHNKEPEPEVSLRKGRMRSVFEESGLDETSIGRHGRVFDTRNSEVPAYQRRKKNVAYHVDNSCANVIEFEEKNKKRTRKIE